MKKGTIVLLVIIAIIALVAIVGVSSYNGLIDVEQDVHAKQGDIDSTLQRRFDLIPNLVETVKGAAAHESEVYESISNARAAMAGASTMQEKADANDAMTTALSRLIAVAEAYPTLTATQAYTDLMTQLEGTENRINVARTEYNDAVKEYNARLRRFPSVIFAGFMGLEKADYFKAASGAETAPTVNFG